MINRIIAFIEKEFIQSIRDLRTVIIVLIIPVSMLVLYAYAINYDIRDIKVGVLNFDQGDKSIELCEKFNNSGYFNLIYFESKESLQQALDRNKIKIGIIIPSDFSQHINQKYNPEIFTLIDGSDSNTARIATNYFFSLYEDFLRGNLGIKDYDPIDFKTRILYNPDMRSLDFVIPGLIAILLMVVGVQLTAPAIVKEKEQGTVETLYTTPISNATIIIGKMVPYAIMGLFDGILVFLVAKFWFHIPFEGNFLVFLGVTLLYLTTCISIGIFISTLTNSQQGSMIISFLSSMLPSIILSGFIFPIKNMPIAMQYVTYLVPARYFIIILRDLFLKGNPVIYYSRQILSLMIFAGIMLSLAWIRMKKKLD